MWKSLHIPLICVGVLYLSCQTFIISLWSTAWGHSSWWGTKVGKHKGTGCRGWPVAAKGHKWHTWRDSSWQLVAETSPLRCLHPKGLLLETVWFGFWLFVCLFFNLFTGIRYTNGTHKWKSVVPSIQTRLNSWDMIPWDVIPNSKWVQTKGLGRNDWSSHLCQLPVHAYSCNLHLVNYVCLYASFSAG